MDPVTDNSTAQTQAVQTDVNDDLAKALASVQAGPQENMNFEAVGEPATELAPAATPVESAPTIATAAPEYSTPPASIDHATDAPVESPVAGTVTPMTVPDPTVSASAPVMSATTPAPAPVGGLDAIEQIKVSALQELRPLMQHIDLSPEERFEKYLMMLRASDDATLIQPTYEAAQKITGEKLRAQALLDVINEINYLSSQQLVA